MSADPRWNIAKDAAKRIIQLVISEAQENGLDVVASRDLPAILELATTEVHQAMIQMEVAWRKEGNKAHAARRRKRMADAIQRMSSPHCPFKCRHIPKISVDKGRIYLYTCPTCKKAYAWAKDVLTALVEEE